MVYQTKKICRIVGWDRGVFLDDTVDGRKSCTSCNMVKIPLFIGLYTSQVVFSGFLVAINSRWSCFLAPQIHFQRVTTHQSKSVKDGFFFDFGRGEKVDGDINS